jgi:putative endonuclease
MEKNYRKEAGDRGEAAALSHLQAAGLTLLQRNYRCNGGEIDLVMRDGKVLVLVEVRYRRDNHFGGAAASVGSHKQQRLLRAAQHLLQTHRAYRNQPARFDLVAIDGDGNNAQLNWIKDAFRQ